jgi:hypothetical protein
MAKSKKDINGNIPEGKSQVNFTIGNDVLEKVKDLAFWEQVSLGEVYSQSVIRYLKLFEDKHGEIQPRPPVKGLDTV